MTWASFHADKSHFTNGKLQEAHCRKYLKDWSSVHKSERAAGGGGSLEVQAYELSGPFGRDYGSGGDYVAGSCVGSGTGLIFPTIGSPL